MKNFLKFCICEIINILIIFDALYCGVSIFFLIVGIFQEWKMIVFSCALTLLFTIIAYLKNRDYFEQLYVKVCMSYKIRDEYKNFVEIKKIINTYEFNGELDVKQNIAVIQASIERDKSNSVFWSAILTACSVILGIIYGKDILTNWYMVIYLILFIVYMKIGMNIPRNSFISKVLDTFAED